MKKFLALFLISFLSFSLVANAATIFVLPATKSVTAGNTFSVSVETDTKGQAVNAVESTIDFPPDLLEVVSIAGAKTFSLQTPGSPGRTDHEVMFSAGIPSPGYTGTKGGIGTITFKALTAGVAHISVSSGKVLLNDGNATDVFDGTSDATITIAPAPVAPPVVVTPVAPVTPAPTVATPAATLPPITITPAAAPVVPVPTITIKVSDLFLLIYVLLAVIMLLTVAVVILVILLLKKNKRIK